MGGFIAIIRRDLLMVIRHGNDAWIVLMFFVVAVTLFPIGIGPDLIVMQKFAGSIIWISALLAAMLSLDRLFQVDFEDGSLDLLVLTSYPLEILVLGKCLVHWLTTGMPILIISPCLALILNLNSDVYTTLILSMLLGTPTISLMGAMGAALVLGSRRSGVLISLLILPLIIPVLIFSVTALERSADAETASSSLMLLGSLLLTSMVFCPWATAATLRYITD
ncbi:MAG: heme exporter protein CcmB [Rhodospirillaceae bacterium]|nr:heme exporter protein CcmB [Rhodospirillaceae bacterium]|tara:strand:+ start:2459 stop:3124 length:666 start_codon:yes stop_codon:yes gene_type:complete